MHWRKILQVFWLREVQGLCNAQHLCGKGGGGKAGKGWETANNRRGGDRQNDGRRQWERILTEV